MHQITEHQELRELAEQMADDPVTVIATHHLRRGTAAAYVHDGAIIVQQNELPAEPSCFGRDPETLWEMLQQVPGWFAANMDADIAAQVADLAGAGARVQQDPHFWLREPVAAVAHSDVRLLRIDDERALVAANPTQATPGFAALADLLLEGAIAGAFAGGQIVATAHTTALSDRYADIGVETQERYRGRGYSTACAALVAAAVQATGRIPTWSCSEYNVASLRVAEKLGFTPCAARAYVILDERR